MSQQASTSIVELENNLNEALPEAYVARVSAQNPVDSGDGLRILSVDANGPGRDREVMTLSVSQAVSLIMILKSKEKDMLEK